MIVAFSFVTLEATQSTVGLKKNTGNIKKKNEQSSQEQKKSKLIQAQNTSSNLYDIAFFKVQNKTFHGIAGKWNGQDVRGKTFNESSNATQLELLENLEKLAIQDSGIPFKDHREFYAYKVGVEKGGALQLCVFSKRLRDVKLKRERQDVVSFQNLPKEQQQTKQTGIAGLIEQSTDMKSQDIKDSNAEKGLIQDQNQVKQETLKKLNEKQAEQKQS
jgi:hypothetical protein